MKKTTIYIIIILLVTVITVSGTYAFFYVATSETNSLAGGTYQLEVLYTGDTEISGSLNLVKTKEGGHRREISIGISENSVGAKAHIYIQIDTITSNIAIGALKWEVYKVENDTEEPYSSGTFLGCGGIGQQKSKCTSGDRIYMITDYELSTTPTQFVVYLWLNGYEADNAVIGGNLTGYIGAESEHVTATLQ